jgi:hypothetical protein
MNLKKMLILAGMALALVAFAAPAAQAHGLLEEGDPIGDESPVTLTSTNLQTVTPLGTLKCEKVTLHYHVEKDGNNGVHVALEPTPAATENAATENCVLNESIPVHISEAGTHTVTIDTWGHGETQASFKGLITHPLFGNITCTYSGKVTVQATDETDIVHIGPSQLASACGEGTMSGEFTMETPETEDETIDPLVADIETTG